MNPISSSSQQGSSGPHLNFQALTSRITQLEDSLSDALRSSRSNDALISSLEDDLRTARTIRDRYREEIDKVIAGNQALLTEVERLREDNMKLKGNMEKLKELEVELEEESDRLQAARDEEFRRQVSLRAENVRLKEKLEKITAERAQPRRAGNLGETSTDIVKGEDAEQHRNVAPVTGRVASSSSSPVRTIKPESNATSTVRKANKSPIPADSEVIELSSDDEGEEQKGSLPTSNANPQQSSSSPPRPLVKKEEASTPHRAARQPTSFPNVPKKENPTSPTIPVKRSPSVARDDITRQSTSSNASARKRRRLSTSKVEQESRALAPDEGQGPELHPASENSNQAVVMQMSDEETPPQIPRNITPFENDSEEALRATTSVTHPTPSTLTPPASTSTLLTITSTKAAPQPAAASLGTFGDMDVDFDGELSELSSSDEEEEEEEEIEIEHPPNHQNASQGPRTSSRLRRRSTRNVMMGSDVDMDENRASDGDYEDGENDSPAEHAKGSSTRGATPKASRVGARQARSLTTDSRKKGKKVKVTPAITTNLSAPAAQATLKAFYATLTYPPPPPSNDGLILLLHDRVKDIPAFPILSLSPHRVGQVRNPAGVSRSFISKHYGTQNCTFHASIAPESNIPVGTRRSMLFPEYNQNPDLPRYPGAPGTIVSVRKELTEKGPIITIWVKMRAAEKEGAEDGQAKGKGRTRAAEKIKPRWMYFGNFEVRKSERPLSGEEFCAMTLDSQKTWIVGLCKSKLKTDAHLATRLLLRQHGRDPDAMDEDEIEEENRSRLSRGSVDDFVNIWQAMRDGKEHLHVWTLRCVGYDEDFARDLEAQSARWDRRK